MTIKVAKATPVLKTKITSKAISYSALRKNCLLYTSIAEEETSYYLENVLEKGRFDVGIAIYQLGSEGTRLSMANNGFEHLACIRNNNRGNWIELIIREMHAHSRIDGADMLSLIHI